MTDLNGEFVGVALLLVYSHIGNVYSMSRVLPLLNTVGCSLHPPRSLVPTTREMQLGSSNSNKWCSCMVSSCSDSFDSWHIAPNHRDDVANGGMPLKVKTSLKLSSKVKLTIKTRYFSILRVFAYQVCFSPCLPLIATLVLYTTSMPFGGVPFRIQAATSNGEAQPYTYDLWDANKMRSCWCNHSMSVNNDFTGTSTTYRGPYSLADTDFYGFNCSLGRSGP